MEHNPKIKINILFVYLSVHGVDYACLKKIFFSLCKCRTVWLWILAFFLIKKLIHFYFFFPQYHES